MKIRNGFVTNSSSSSFIISKRHLDEDQIEAIREHESLGKELGIWDSGEFPWSIEENNEYISGYTFMDNFSMSDFLDKIGVPDKFVQWSDFEFDIYDNEDVDEYVKEEDWREILHRL